MFSNRLPPHGDTNELSRAIASLTAGGVEILDLTESNPTRAGISYAGIDVAMLADRSVLTYEPHPFGLLSARTAVALDQGRRGVTIDPADVVLTASTSEAYSWLFKLFCNPGDRVLVPAPSYPLFEHLTALEGVRAHQYRLQYDGRWSVDIPSVADAPSDVRALLVVSPNNPTGSYLTQPELDAIVALCRERRWPLIVDEVFADYPLDVLDPVTDIASRSDVVTFTLAGLSKSVGLPQMKLGWMIAGGPRDERERTLAALELVADSYLSVNTPVQIAAPELLRGGASVREAIQNRTRGNLRTLRRLAGSHPACDVLRADGGWSVVVRVPSTRSEEQLVLDLLQQEHILVHPGYFFDFFHESFVVISLLPPPDRFEAAAGRFLHFVTR
jgi:aspartate/methionine/tyrosine aminotransferase